MSPFRMDVFKAKFLFKLNLVQNQQRFIRKKRALQLPVVQLKKTGEKPKNETGSSTPLRVKNACRARAPSQKLMINKPMGIAAQLVAIEKEARWKHLDANMGKINGEYRRLSMSPSYKNATLPLKASKLADPFPDPVKTKPSQTVSDREKADQMLRDSRKVVVAPKIVRSKK